MQWTGNALGGDRTAQDASAGKAGTGAGRTLPGLHFRWLFDSVGPHARSPAAWQAICLQLDRLPVPGEPEEPDAGNTS
jgi:hypothetical protein